VRNSIPADPAPNIHLRLIVDTLDNWPPLASGEQPLLLLIQAAADQVEGAQLAVAFRQLRDQVHARWATRPPEPAPRSAPVAPNPFYGDSVRPVGREEELRRIGEKLRAGNHCSIVGPPGSGKTLLLREAWTHLPERLGWPAAEVLRIGFRAISRLTELQQALVDAMGGGRPADLRRLLRSQPLRLLALDDLGWMGIGNEGLKMRRWLRGFAEDSNVQLLITSNKPLDILFRADDPTVDSPFENLDKLPVVLAPLSPAACQQLVTQRLAGTSLTADVFSGLLTEPHQPKELLNLCAARYQEFVGSAG
jgi:hypothetical protein